MTYRKQYAEIGKKVDTFMKTILTELDHLAILSMDGHH